MRRYYVLTFSLLLILVAAIAVIAGPANAQPPTASPDVSYVTGLSSGAFNTAQSDETTTAHTVSWTKYADNPVLLPGPAGSWDATNVELATVLRRGDTYELWYTGDRGTDSSGRIGYATSSNGIDWTRAKNTPVLNVGSGSAWDSGYVVAPHVVFHEGLYRMWYRGTDTPDTFSGTAIGYATSPDGINWTKHSENPVLTVGSSGQWDDYNIWNASVIVEDGEYKMWYSAGDGSRYRIGYATSPDGVNWTKYAGNPVLTPGSAGSWDSNRVYYPTVVAHDCAYEMWYSGYDGTKFAIGYATSLDGVNWQRDSSNPVLQRGPAGSWDSSLVIAPAVFADGRIHRLWYTGKSEKTNLAIGYATGPEKIVCPYVRATSPSDGAGFVRVDEPIVVRFNKPMDTSSMVLHDGTGTTLPYTPTWNTDNTVVSFSHPPFDYSTSHTVAITGTDESGLPLVAGDVPSTWSFTVTDDAPHVQKTRPADGATDVPVDEPIEIIFSKAMNTTTVVLRDGSGSELPYTAIWSAGNTEVRYDHPDFERNTSVSLSIEGQDESGKALTAGDAPTSWSFTVTGWKTYAPVVQN